MYKGLFRCLFYILFLISYSCGAGAVQIVAIVGTEAITDYEVLQRAKVVALAHGYNANDIDILNSAKEDIIDVLIDEHIRFSFVERAGFNIEQEDIDRAIEDYSKKIGVKNQAELKAKLAKYEIDWDSFYKTVKDEVTWQKFIYFAMIGSIIVSDGEAIQRARARGLDDSSPFILDSIKREIATERLQIQINKSIKQARKFHVVESFY